MRRRLLGADAVLEVGYLLIPELLAAVEVGFFGKVGDAKNRLVGDDALLNAKFEKFVFIVIFPAVPHIVIFKNFGAFGSIYGAIPIEIKGVFALVNLFCKPFLQTYCGG